MKRRHQPQRTCLGCGARDEKRLLVRLATRGAGELAIDQSGRGRGGYVHPAEECWQAFLRRKSVYRAFHVEIGRETRERVITTLRKRLRE
ncbi:MAG: YlxR family protein [Deltaproteobacteria bacterium]|nr:YlxR family protein [Deltaproteobacteria bacterium]